MAPTKERPATKTIATNREARHEYFVLEALETGVELKGTEVKSLRAGGVNLKDSWVDIEDGELLVKGMHISPYDHGNMFNQDPMRVRRLLAHKSEIRRLHQQCKLQGYTLVPLSLYFKHGRVKMEVGLCKGKKLYDKFMQMYKDKGHILTGKDIYIDHSLTDEKLAEFTAAAERAFEPSSVKTAELGATIGSHAGPGLSAVMYIKD